MRLQTNIFMWGFFAFLFPITTLALVVSYYSQASYHEDVSNNIDRNLHSISSEINRRLSADRSLTLGLSQAPAVRAFLPILEQISNQRIPAELSNNIEMINRFFEGFQTIIPGSFIIRILDSQGNTLVKINHKQRSLPVYDSLLGISYVEQELNNPDFVQHLKSLTKDDVATLVLPHNKAQSSLLNHLSLLDNVIPLYYKDKWVGALSVSIFGEDIDKILNHALRPYAGQFIIAEVNPDVAQRNGLVLFDDAQKLIFAHARPTPRYLQHVDAKSILNNLSDSDTGILTSKNESNTLHYIISTPYPSQFINWIVGLNVDTQTINQPYKKIRIVIWMIAAFTLFIGLMLTHIGAYRITRTLSALVNNLKKYTIGNNQQIALTDNCVDEIKDLGLAFNEMTNNLDLAHMERDKAQQMMLQSSKLASIGQMAAGIGHEINNPLNNILSYAKLAIRNLEATLDTVDQNKKATILKDLNSLREETLRASEIVKGIMNFARQVPPHFTQFNIKDWLNNSIALVHQSANEKNITLNLNVDITDSANLTGDRGQLQQVLINLLLNAIQASNDKSEINIAVSIDDNLLEIVITDHGSGIDKNVLELIFDPFFTTKQDTQGTGLGLSISLGIIQDHHGQLEIDNNKDTSGVTARILLPIDLPLNH